MQQLTREERERQEHKTRFCRVWVEITDSRGRVKRYALKPLPLPLGYTKRFRLVKYDVTRKAEARYNVFTTDQGQTRCTCRASSFGKPCKHIASLKAAGIL